VSTQSPIPNPQSRHGAAAPRIALVAGEASGDLLGAGLIERLRARYPGATFAGVGGPQMQAAGFEAWHDCGELAVMGLAEVLRHLPRLLRLRRGLRARLLAWRPDVFVGIDAPDFNLGLERRLKQAGIRTVHYVSPSVWAWREGRAAKIGRSADRVLCLFPMEPPIYARHGVEARFVGHPLADALPLQPDRAAARDALGLPQDVPVLAVLPGSRLGEIARLGPVFLEGASRVAAEVPGLHVVVPAANAACRGALEPLLSDSRFPIPRSRLLDQQAHECMTAADVVLLASGTATLEALLAKRAMVVGYRIAALTYAIVRGFGMMKTDQYSLPNALAGERLVPELMQADCTADKLATEVLAWLRDPARIAALQPRFEAIHRELRRDASARAAEAVAELIDAG
jgi:lipid-A-disaccharide synthase